MNKNKKLGFTLAEVLIVIGIIGVVAALTLPNLNHATGDKERVTKVKKIYSALTEAFDRAQAIYGDVDSWLTDLDCYGDDEILCDERLGQRITEFMKISKVCGTEAGKGCFTSGNSKFLYGATSSDFDSSSNYKVITSDGMSLSIGNGYNPQFYVDIDGPQKGSYSFGYDLFVFYTSDSEPRFIYPSKTGPGSGFILWGNAAASWIIEHDNADYLKAAENGKCNDSDIVLNWTTNTSCH